MLLGSSSPPALTTSASRVFVLASRVFVLAKVAGELSCLHRMTRASLPENYSLEFLSKLKIRLSAQPALLSHICSLTGID